jgi:glucose uptake protein
MIFPSTYLGSLLLLLLSLFCMGTWIVMQKMTVQWRFELFYIDLTFGMVLTAVVAAFTFGTMDSTNLSFQDNFLFTAYRKFAWALLAGVVFNLGAILLLAATVLSRMSVAFPISFGLALVVGAVWDFFSGVPGDAVPIFSGAVLLLATILLSALAFRWFIDETQPAPQRGFVPAPRSQRSSPRAKFAVSLFLALASGIALGVSGPLVTESMSSEVGASAYGAFLLFSASALISSLFFVPFFLNFPVQGEPVQVRQYFKGTKKQHLLGLFAGILLGTGVLAKMVAAGGNPPSGVQPLLAYVLGGSAAVLAALWGLIPWREFKGASSRVVMMLLSGLVLYLAGVAVIAAGRSVQ